jgi:hypothetical protein
MKMQSKPIVAVSAGVLLLLGALCQTAQAQITNEIESGVATLAAVNDVGADALTVNYQVAFVSGGGPSFYIYDYNVSTPANSGESITLFQVDFNADFVNPITGDESYLPGSGAGTTLGDISQPTAVGVTWANISTGKLTTPGTSDTLSFNSDLGPTSSTANAQGSINPPAGWSSLPAGQFVPVPNVVPVPEPATTTMFALALVLLAFRPNLLKKA